MTSSFPRLPSRIIRRSRREPGEGAATLKWTPRPAGPRAFRSRRDALITCRYIDWSGELQTVGSKFRTSTGIIADLTFIEADKHVSKACRVAFVAYAEGRACTINNLFSSCVPTAIETYHSPYASHASRTGKYYVRMRRARCLPFGLQRCNRQSVK